MPAVLNVVTLLYYFIFASLLIVVFVYDLKRKIISDFASFGIFGLAVMRIIVQGYYFQYRISFWVNSVFYDLVMALGIFALFGSIWFFSKGKAMGFGDVKFAPASALFLGFPNGIVAILLSFWIGSLVGVFLVLLPPSFQPAFQKFAARFSGYLRFPAPKDLITSDVAKTKKFGLKSEIPFGPFIALGSFIALLWGEMLIVAYFDFLIRL